MGGLVDLVAGLQISQFLTFLYRFFELGSVSPTWCPGFLQCCALGWHVIPRSMHFPQASREGVALVGFWGFGVFGIAPAALNLDLLVQLGVRASCSAVL